jgi:hypothetical protein
MTVPVPAQLPSLTRPLSTLRSPSHGRLTATNLPFSPHHRTITAPNTIPSPSVSPHVATPSTNSSTNGERELYLSDNISSGRLTPTPPAMPSPAAMSMSSQTSGRSTPTPSTPSAAAMASLTSGRLTPTHQNHNNGNILSGRSTPTSMMRNASRERSFAVAPSTNYGINTFNNSNSNGNGNGNGSGSGSASTSTSIQMRRPLRNDVGSALRPNYLQSDDTMMPPPSSLPRSSSLSLLGGHVTHTRLEPIISPHSSHEPLPSPTASLPLPTPPLLQTSSSMLHPPPLSSPSSSPSSSSPLTVSSSRRNGAALVISPRESRASSMINANQLPSSRRNNRVITSKPRQASLPMTSPRAAGGGSAAGTPISGAIILPSANTGHTITLPSSLPISVPTTLPLSPSTVSSTYVASKANNNINTTSSGTINTSGITTRYAVSLQSSPGRPRKWEDDDDDYGHDINDDNDEEDDDMHRERESARLRDQMDALAHHNNSSNNNNSTANSNINDDDASLDSPNVPLSATAAAAIGGFARRRQAASDTSQLGSIKQTAEQITRKSRRAPISLSLASGVTNGNGSGHTTMSNSNSNDMFVRPPPLAIPDVHEDDNDSSVSRSDSVTDERSATTTTLSIAAVVAASSTPILHPNAAPLVSHLRSSILCIQISDYHSFDYM